MEGVIFYWQMMFISGHPDYPLVICDIAMEAMVHR